MMNQELLYKSYDRPLAVIASSSNTEGHCLAKKFAENGYDIIIAARNPSVVEEAQEFKALGIDAVSFQLDLSTKAGIEQLYSRIVATGRPVEALIINSGISVDLTNETELARKVLKDMVGTGSGRILFAGIDDNDQKIMTRACKEIKKQAEGSRVTVDALQPGNH
ncbi:MAG: SDR family NAD(P)-dependent oxidoreductase [Bdellovibrionales bacterium]|nr:SDR family NAD(P)-dependent oxidoreductase [Bdellovibrionales bacterium]